MERLKSHFFSIDPRTLGFTRILLGSLLLFDLGKRSFELEHWYANQGLIPNHTVLWRPIREWMISPLFSLSWSYEAAAIFVVIAVVYSCFLVGFKTRLMHVLSLLALISLQTRIDFVSNGGDFVFCNMMLWTAFLPMGKRFSVDAIALSLKSHCERRPEDLTRAERPPRETEPVVSVAVLAALLQLSVIYFFNTVHKNGQTWEQGTAVYYLLQQERVVTPLGLWVRDHLPLQFSYVTTYGTLVIEGLAPVFILSPIGKPWTRRVAMLTLWGLHGSILLLADVGLFSPVMMVFVTLLATSKDWEWVERVAHGRKRLHRRVRFDPDCGGCFWLARLFRRLDWFERLQLVPDTASGASPDEEPASRGDMLTVTDPHTGKHWEQSRALGQALRALPLGGLYAWPLIALPAAFDPLYRIASKRRAQSESFFGPRAGVPLARESGPARESLFPGLRAQARQIAGLLREYAVIILLVVAGSQVLVENRVIPPFLKIEQPRWMTAAVAYLRLNQGWSMFAPDAPVADLWMVVDATTADGRHVDPFNEVASRIADPTLRELPEQLGTSVYYRKYAERIPGRGVYHRPFADWLFSYHERTGRPEDRIVAFDVYLIERDSPRPGESEPRNERVRRILSRRRKSAR